MNRTTRVPHLSLLTFLGLSLSVLFAAWKFRDNDTRAGQQEADLVTEQVARRLEESLRSQLIGVEVILAAIREGKIENRESFEAYSRTVLDNFDGLLAINWVDAYGVVRWVTPTEENAAALDLDLRENEIAGPILEEARRTRQPRMTPPLELYQGGLGVATYFPLVSDDGWVEGFVNGVFRLQPVLETVFSGGALDEYVLWVRDGIVDIRGAERSFLSGSKKEILAAQVVTILDRKWKLSCSPNLQAWSLARTSFHLTFLALGLGLAAALAIGLHFHSARQRSRQRDLEVRSELEGRLLQAQKMEAVGRLAGGVAHDFNNLLTAILGNADLVEDLSVLDDDARAALNQIRIAGDRATRLTSQLLTISRRQVVPSPAIDLNCEIRTLDGVLRRLVRENIQFVTSIAEERSVIDLDAGQLSQIVINLVVNAVEAMPEGGRLLLTTEPMGRGPEGRPGRWAVLSVEDTGAGMDENTRLRALEPFFTTKGLARGTGLGLATVDGITTSAGGQVRIETQPTAGTKVSVWFPISGKLLEEPSAPVGTSLEGGVALVVEDEPSVLKIAARALTEAGYEVVTATDGQEALERVDAGLRFDLLLTDAVMPRLGGRGLLEQLRLRELDFVAVITSGYPEEFDAGDIERLDAAFLSKPFSAQTLTRAVCKASETSTRVG
jgi:signal transduction histidine kinase/CheY-like chemotaxis protein